MNPHHSLGVGGGIGAGVGGGVGLGLGVGVGGWMLVRRSYKRKTNITTPKYLPDAEYIILYRVYRMYPDRGTTRVKRAANSSPTRGGGGATILGVGGGIGAGVDGGVGLGLGVGVDGWMLV